MFYSHLRYTKSDLDFFFFVPTIQEQVLSSEKENTKYGHNEVANKTIEYER